MLEIKSLTRLQIIKYCEKLEKEKRELEYLGDINEELKEENNRLKNNAMEDMRVQTKLEEENKKLKEQLDIATKCSNQEEYGIVKLHKEIDILNSQISSYKKEIDRLNIDLKMYENAYGRMFE